MGFFSFFEENERTKCKYSWSENSQLIMHKKNPKQQEQKKQPKDKKTPNNEKTGTPLKLEKELRKTGRTKHAWKFPNRSW